MSVEVTPDRIAIWHHAESATDERLRSAVEDELRADADVKATDITVSVAGGTVTLSGIVRTPTERSKALAGARRVTGTKPVRDMLAIRHSNEGAELRRAISDAIGRSFHREADIDAANVGVVCEHGTVWLTGRVQSFAARVSAENAAWATPGVTEVNNDIRVGSYDPRIGADNDDVG